MTQARKLKAPLLNKEPYHVRRVCGQLAVLPAGWWALIEKVDIHPVNVCIRLKLAEERTLPGGGKAYRATDKGRAAWNEFTEQGPTT